MTELRDCVVAVDIGGTTLKGAAFDRRGRVLAARTRPTFGVCERAADSLSALVRELLDLMREQDRCPAAIGIASPGMVDTRRGIVISAVNLGWSGLPLRARLRDEFGLPVALEHDARAAALGEQAAQPGSLRDFAFIPIGTGIAAAIVTGGQLMAGATGSAGEFGHIPVVPGGRRCACGQLGCIEAYASGPAIEARYRELGGGQRSTADIAGRAVRATTAAAIPAIPATTVPPATTGGPGGADRDAPDEGARRVWAEAIDALAAGLLGLVALTDPAAVIIGGGVAEAGAALLDPLTVALAARLTWRSHPRLLLSVLGPRAGLIGAGLCGWALAPAPSAPAETGTAAPGTAEPGTGEPGTAEPGTGEPGTGEPGTAAPGAASPAWTAANGSVAAGPDPGPAGGFASTALAELSSTATGEDRP